MPQKLNSFISLLETIFHTTMISSSKTHNSSLHLFLIFLVFLFLVIFLGKITLLLFLNKLVRGWVSEALSDLLHDTFNISSHLPSCLLCIGVLFATVWSVLHTSGVVPHTQLSWKRWSLELFALSILLLSLILSNLFLPVEMLRHSLSTIAIT